MVTNKQIDIQAKYVYIYTVCNMHSLGLVSGYEEISEKKKIDLIC